MMPDAWVTLLGQLEFWRGFGRLVVDLTLLVAMVFVVMSISGHPVRLRRAVARPKGEGRHKDPVGSEEDQDEDDTGPAKPTSDSLRLAHLDLLASLRHSLELQGATIVLIVFAVVLLAFNHILGGSEVATILAGITGYVLGSRSQAGAGPSATGGGKKDAAVGP